MLETSQAPPFPLLEGTLRNADHWTRHIWRKEEAFTTTLVEENSEETNPE